MAIPSNYKTGAVDIGVNAYSKPVNETAVNALGSIFETLTKAEKENRASSFKEQERTYQREVEAELTAADKGIGLFARGSRLELEAQKRQLTDEENRTLGQYKEAMVSNEEAYAQGRVAYRRYLLDAQSRLRAAITNRPDLADEFRRMSVQELGVDVGNAAMQLWQEDMEYLKASGKKETKYKATDVLTVGKNQLEALKSANSTQYEAVAAAVLKANTMAYSDPDTAMALIEAAVQQAAGNDPNITVSADIKKTSRMIDNIEQQVFMLGDLLRNQPDYYNSNPEAFEGLKQQYQTQRASLLATKRTLEGYSNSYMGESAQREIERIDNILATVMKDESITPEQLSSSAKSVVLAAQTGVDRVVATSVNNAVNPAASDEIKAVAAAVAGAGQAGLEAKDYIIPSRQAARLADNRALGVAVDALTSNVIGRNNVTIDTFRRSAYDGIRTLNNVSGAAYYKYDTGQRDKSGNPKLTYIGIDGFYGRGSGAILKLAAATTETDEEAGNGYLDDLIKYGPPNSKEVVTYSVAMMITGAAASLFTDMLYALPTPELQAEFFNKYYPVDIASQIQSKQPFTSIPKAFERKIVNGNKVEPSKELASAINAWSTNRAASYKDGFAAWNKLAGFVVRNSVATPPKADTKEPKGFVDSAIDAVTDVFK